MVAEGGTHVVVGLETVWHVNFKALLLELWRKKDILMTWMTIGGKAILTSDLWHFIGLCTCLILFSFWLCLLRQHQSLYRQEWPHWWVQKPTYFFLPTVILNVSLKPYTMSGGILLISWSLITFIHLYWCLVNTASYWTSTLTSIKCVVCAFVLNSDEKHLQVQWYYQHCSYWWERTLHYSSKNQSEKSPHSCEILRHMESAHSTWCTAEICDTYHSITTVGSSTSTSADDFVYAFLVDGCIAFW